jgi:mono/diheme cytochrome c family protein
MSGSGIRKNSDRGQVAYKDALVRGNWPILVIVSLLASARLAMAAEGDRAATPADAEFFEQRIRPVLTESCFECHSARAKELQSKLFLDSREGMLKGGENGPAIVPGHPEKSRLIVAIGYENVDLQMPPKGKLSDRAIADIQEWIRRGAPWPITAREPAATASNPTSPAIAKFDLAARKAAHWAWQPVKAMTPSPVTDEKWCADSLDRFILAKLEANDLKPAATADRRTLIRRVYFDLIGLPPAPDEVERFLKDSSPDAWVKVVDHLLASPHFGERWGRHWLDLARYAETRGHEYDYAAPHAWQYRDWVIRALKADLPYNQFVAEQIAGDLLPEPRYDPTGQINESVVGTGFWFLGEWLHSPVDIRQDETDRVDNQIDVMAKTFLGLTVGCARCHDHKFDAISTKDYYALAGIVESSSYRETHFQSQRENRRIVEQFAAVDIKARETALRATAESLQPTLSRMADYLIAAGEIVQNDALESDSGGKPSADAAVASVRVQTIAKDKRLDTAILASFCDEIRRAAADRFSPVHPFFALARGASREDPERFADALKPIAAEWQAEQRRAAVQPPGMSFVVDYGKLGPHDWITDDLAFGDRALRAGELIRGADNKLAILDTGAAYCGLSGLPVPGMLRTPTFIVSAPIVWYRMRGAGEVFVVVDSYRMIQGPLHGSLRRHVDVGTAWSWQSTDLHDYIGHRAHIEFTPDPPPASLAVSVVAQAESAPSEPSRANGLLLAALTKNPPSSSVELAKTYERLFKETAESLGSGRLADGADAADRAAMANWLLQHAASLTPNDKHRQPSTDADASSAIAQQRAALVAQLKPSAVAMAMLDGSGFDEHVLIRGSHKNQGELVPRRFLEAIAGNNQAPIVSGSGRLELARRMTDPANPFISRVIVNRVWHHLFGRGIVPTVDNFGVLGQPPTHPELHDSLADGFLRDGWSIKRLIRRIVMSSTYQMSSRPSERAARIDPQNLLWQHASIRRLEGEAIRDSILTVSGRLNRQSGGPSVEIYVTPFMEGRGVPTASGPLDGDGRRSIYLRVLRNFLTPMMTAFDTPTPFSTIGRRSVSNLPAQALILLNDPFVIEQSHVWARRVLADVKLSPAERIRQMYETALCRPPSDKEISAALEFLNQQAEQLGIAPSNRLTDERPWADLGHVLFNVKEFVFID